MKLAERAEKNLIVENVLAARVRPLELSEAAGAPKGTLGILEIDVAKVDIVNRNGRYYSKRVYELANDRAQPFIEDGNFLGEVDHPWGAGSLRDAAIRFTRMWMDGELLKAEGVILGTQWGLHLKALLDGGVGVKVSTRGYGSAEEKEMVLPDGSTVYAAVIGEDFWLEGIDVVLRPSNIAGAVTAHHESQEVQMDLSKLKADFPALVAQIVAEATEGLVASDAVTAQVEAARTEVRESQDFKDGETARVAIVGILEALKPFLPEVQEAQEAQAASALATQVADLTATVEALNAQRVAADAARVVAETEAARVAEQATLQAHIATLLGEYADADLVRESVEAATTIEQADTVFRTESEKITALRARLAAAPGDTGKQEKTDVGAGAEPLSEDEKTKAEERRLAGL